MQELRLKIGAPPGRLAIAQTNIVAGALQRAWPRLQLDFVTPDPSEVTPPSPGMHGPEEAEMQVAALAAMLLDRRIDVAVHGMAGMPATLPGGVELGPVPERAAVHDVMATREPMPWRESPASLRIGTSTPRRQAEIRRINPRLVATPVRGNLATRIEKLRAGNVDGLLLGAAELGWLKVTPPFAETLPIEEFVPSPGQGALALLVRGRDAETGRLLAALRDPVADVCVRAERALLAALGGGRSLALGALAGVRDGKLLLHARLLSPDGARVCDMRAEGDLRRPVAVAEELAARMLEAGGVEITRNSGTE